MVANTLELEVVVVVVVVVLLVVVVVVVVVVFIDDEMVVVVDDDVNDDDDDETFITAADVLLVDNDVDDDKEVEEARETLECITDVEETTTAAAQVTVPELLLVKGTVALLQLLGAGELLLDLGATRLLP